MSAWYPARTFGSLPDEMAARFPEREALVFEAQRYTFAQVARRIDEVARGFIAEGVASGEHVALWLNNRAEWIFAMYALAKIGAVHVPVNTRFRTHDLSYVLRQSDSVALVTHATCGPVDYLGMVREVVTLPAGGWEVDDPEFPRLRRVVIVDEHEHPGTRSWNAVRVSAAATPLDVLAQRSAAVDPQAPVFVMYTSGTTGFPKGVVHSHKLVRNVEERAMRMAITENDVILGYLPLFHAFGYSEAALMQMVTGAKHVITETFDPEECLDLVVRERITVMHGFEAHMMGLTEAQLRRPRDLSTLRTGIFAAGMHSATPVVRRGAEVLAPLRHMTGFGMTEVWLGVSLTALDDDLERRCETSGYPGLGYEVRVVDPETGSDQPPGVPGELLVRGYSLMLGYYEKPEETAACYDADGWFHTGDTALVRADGYIRFLGRYKDMLKIGGENVDPMEVEGLLLGHPGVREVAVVGLPDARLAEIPVAYIGRAPGTELEADEVIGYCRGKIASFKIPRHVVFLDEFPMTASGKIRKVDLRADARRRLLPDAVIAGQ